MNFLVYRDSEKRPFYPHRSFYSVLSLDSIFKTQYQLAILWYFKYVTRGYYIAAAEKVKRETRISGKPQLACIWCLILALFYGALGKV